MEERVSSRLTIKFSKDQIRRSTQTKASASKPNLYISAAKNNDYKNKNANFFHSNRKYNKQNQNYLQVASGFKQDVSKGTQKKYLANNHPSYFLLACQQINKKMSVEYINSLYSDILIQMIYHLNDQEYIKKQQLKKIGEGALLTKYKKIQYLKQTIHKSIKQNILLKEKVSKSYQKMTQTQALLSYFRQQKPQVLQKVLNENRQSKKLAIQKIVKTFIEEYNEKQSKLKFLNQQNLSEKKKQLQNKQSLTQNEYKQKEKKLVQLQQQLQKERKINQKYQKEEQYLLSKLYNYQNQGIKTIGSSTTLKIKLTNLEDTIKLKCKNKSNLKLNLLLQKKLQNKQDQEDSKKSFRSLDLSKNGNNQRSMSLTNLGKQFGRIKRFQINPNSSKTMLKNSQSLKFLPKLTKNNLIQNHKNNYFNQIH